MNNDTDHITIDADPTAEADTLQCSVPEEEDASPAETANIPEEDSTSSPEAANDPEEEDTVSPEAGNDEPKEQTETVPARPKKQRRVLHIILMILTLLLSGIGALIHLSIRYMFQIWAGGSIQELVYTMTGNLDGVNSDMILSGVLQIGVPIILLIALYILLNKFWISGKKPYVFHLINLLLVCSLMGGAGYSMYRTWKQLDVKSYLAEQGYIELHDVKTILKTGVEGCSAACIEEALKYANGDEQTLLEIQKRRLEMSFIDANFVDPAEVEITAPKQKRNLILIFLESMETTYSDKANGGAYDINYISELTEISKQGENFSGSGSTINGAEVLTYSTWTMAGIFAQTAGLPLNISVGNNQMDTQETFLPSVTTLGDILKEQGYNQAFQCGSDVRFGGRKAYFQTHGGFTFHDLDSAWTEGSVQYGRKVWWGYEDLHLFDIAKEKITEMAAQDAPFNYTMLTVDTHYPDGYTCSLCGKDKTFTTSSYYNTPYGNVISCSSKQVSEFISWIQEQDFYENTTVVLLGDHLTMDKNFCSDIDSGYVRKTYVSYLNSAVEPELDTAREYVTEDAFPTILASLGYKIVGNKLALGTNLFSSVPTLVEEYGYTDMNTGITQPSDYMTSINEEIDVSAAEGKYNVYKADIVVSDLDPATNTYTITVKNITSSTGIGKISLALNTYDDESDNVWVTAYHQTDDTYQATIYKNNYAYNPEGTIKIEAYVYDWSWNSHFLNKTYLPLAETTPPTAD